MISMISQHLHYYRHDSSRGWQWIQSITRSEDILRYFLFIIFAVLHIANLVWLLSNAASLIPKLFKILESFQNNASFVVIQS